MSATLPQLLVHFQPVSFRERGVHVPFTTPLLTGACARNGGREGAELVLPNPSGKRGVYIRPWSGAHELCRLSMHDFRLHARVGMLPALTPMAVRRVAREAAADGFAGRVAAEAARAAHHAEALMRLEVSGHLLRAIVRCAESVSGRSAAPIHDGQQPPEARVQEALPFFARTLGRSTLDIANAIEKMTGPMTVLGLGPKAEEARVPRMIAALQAMRDGTTNNPPRNDSGALANATLIANRSTAVLGGASATLAEARGLVADPLALIGAWLADAELAEARMMRADWLLDGWELPCLLWLTAETPLVQEARFNEIAALVPILPREAHEWIDLPLTGNPAPVTKPSLGRETDGRSTQQATLVARNEKMRAEGMRLLAA